MTQDLELKDWHQLMFGKIDSSLLTLKNYDNEYYWDKVDPNSLRYFVKTVLGSPWQNHLGLSLLCLTDRNLTPLSIYNLMSNVNARLRDLFDAANLVEMADFNYSIVEKYLSSELIQNHTDRQRQSFLNAYNSFVFNMSKWLTTQFTNVQQKLISNFLFPKLPFDNRDFSVRTKAIDAAKEVRKTEASAVTPLLPEIRAEAHFRWNQVERLRRAVKKLLEEAKETRRALPIEFSYEESEYTNERWHFILWDKISFGDRYSVGTSTENEVFLEFIKAEKIDDSSPGEGLWFLDILKYRLIGSWSSDYLSDKERNTIVNFLKQWGYDDAENGQAPFSHRNPGLLTQGVFVVRNSRNFNKLLINLEPIYAACTFARFALDIITSSGARMNELLQISYDKNCCVVTVDNSIVPARKNYIFRLIPKGREEEENYYMPEEVFRFMNDIIKYLKESYNSKSIPEVEYRVSSRKHLMSNKRYVFQYYGRHINEFTINAIIRFLLHGLIIQTSEGNQVVVKTHLLRHAFATHAVQTEKIPIDIVKTLLHQKDISVTEYYSAPTNQQITETIDFLHDNWASYIDIQKGVLRGPEELREIYDDYREKVGTLSKVVGGICTTDSVCPTRLACVGCAAKVPRPEFKQEILSYLKWAEESEVMFTQNGMLLEAKKMKISKNRAKNELKEIELMERYQKDEHFEAKIRINN
ncbi:site-specific integrase [Paenibacillus sp. SYP-B3998]|uniref:Site-specific integrase n=1 Tax=Paenibacillus sp. SYP-B3998 TaxID=2678564 RepID=A0A6G3ZXQ6_9BACL|nr:site-specific integrase [Paenibacillus sp. SYP-B3998]NEW06870.1 site-specific integrase [Paenibacillus sp. SYP-B3998]